MMTFAPTTPAFAPSPEDLEDISFGASEVHYAFTTPPKDAEESEQGEP